MSTSLNQTGLAEIDNELTSIWPGEGGEESIAMRSRARELGLPLSMLPSAERDAVILNLAKNKAKSVNRAYARLDVKAVAESDTEYTITGIASTPTPDRMGDIVEPMGAKYKLPMPLLWQHDSTKPVGYVNFASPTAKGIPFEAKLPKVAESGTLKDRIDEAIQSIKYKLVAGISIGFQAINNAVEYLKSGGVLFKEWEWLELSLVTIPANAEATIQTFKSLDRKAASGKTVSIHSGASAKTQSREKSMNVQDQIKQFEATRQAKAAALEEIIKKSGETGETMDAETAENFDALEKEIETLDKHLTRLRSVEKTMAVKSQRVVSEGNDANATVAAQGNKGDGVVAVEKKLAPGIGFARFVKLSAMAQGRMTDAFQFAQEMYPNEKPLHDIFKMFARNGMDYVMKNTVTGGNTTDSTWAAPLVNYQVLANEFIEYLRPQTIVGRIPGFRRVPFKVKVPRQTAGGSAYWVGEGKPKPLTSLAFDSVTLDITKIATISVLTDELIRLSNPSAEAIVRDQLAQAIVQQLDQDFIDPDNAGSGTSKPASVTNAVAAIPSGGGVAQADVLKDLQLLFAPWVTGNISAAGGVLVMSASTALALSLMVNALGQPAFPGVSLTGGTLAGLPVIVSENAGLQSNTSGDYLVVLLKPSDILLADDGQVTIDASREAAVQMLDNPTNATDGTATSMVSMFQTNSVAIRAERFINWTKARSTAAEYLRGVKWGQ